MLRAGFQRLAFALLAMACASASVQKIGPDLYAYISTNDASANSTFLVGDKGILVVDTGLNAQEGRKLLDEIRKISPLPVRWIVNTHYHSDHRGGNSVVGPEAAIISTEFTHEQVVRGLQTQAAKAGRGLANEYSPVVAIGAARNDDLTLYVGGHEVRICYPGPAHTRGDLVVYFPDQHAIATGDLFLNNSCPAMDDGDMENWIAALDQILTLPLEHVVPGHFELATKDQVRLFRDYLADLRDQVARMYGQRFSLTQVKQNLDMGKYKGLRQFPKYEATFADNAAAYYRQLEARKRTGLGVSQSH
ncbi:MAG TPA: MBL fold metallo-hydrolase [Candidatus Angelobacter sp.]